MGVRRLFSFLKRERDSFTEYQPRKEQGKAFSASSADRIFVVVDGCSVECSIFESLLMRFLPDAFSYEVIAEYTDTIFRTLQQYNVFVECLFVDTLYDLDKIDKYATRLNKRLSRGAFLRTVLNGNYLQSVPKRCVGGLPHLPLYAYAVRDTILKYCLKEKEIRLACSDPDR